MFFSQLLKQTLQYCPGSGNSQALASVFGKVRELLFGGGLGFFRGGGSGLARFSKDLLCLREKVLRHVHLKIETGQHMGAHQHGGNVAGF
jgi:hypothetical protein